MRLKTAYEIAIDRSFECVESERANSYRKVVKTPDSDIYGDLPDDFFVDAWPNEMRNSRRLTVAERKAESDLKQKEHWTMKGDKHSMPTEDAGLSAIIEGPFLSFSGYSVMNRNVAKSLTRCGVAVRTVIQKTEEKITEEEAKVFKALMSTKVSPKAPYVHGMTTPAIISGDRYNVLYTMMETSNAVHPAYAGKLNLAKEVWVPSDYQRDVLIHSGVKVPIMVFPLGIDPDLFNPSVEPLALGHIKESFKFISVFNWGFRKGYDILLKTYLRSFTSQDDVCLILVSQVHGNKNGKQLILDTLKSFQKSAAKENEDLPKVYLIYGGIPEANMAGLYRACDAFVLLSRGEGMGLPYLEAGACGLPVMGTACTAQTSFLDEETAYMVSPDGYTATKISDPPNINMAKSCFFYENQEFPFFGKTAESSAISMFRSMRYGDLENRKKASLLAQRIHSSFTWDTTAVRIRNRIEEIMER